MPSHPVYVTSKTFESHTLVRHYYSGYENEFYGLCTGINLMLL